MKRYNFSGFSFGKDGTVIFQVEVLNPSSEFGTFYSTKVELELTPEERTELVTKLISIK